MFVSGSQLRIGAVPRPIGVGLAEVCFGFGCVFAEGPERSSTKSSEEMIMNTVRVSRFLFVPLLASAGFAVAPMMHAQDNSDNKVLVIQREYTKPGKDGAVHEGTEAGFIRAVQANKGNIHYIALTSLSGANRAVFVSGYSSLAALDAERKAMPAAALMAMDKAMVADGESLTETGSSVWLRRDDLSTNVSGPPVGMRLMEVSEYVVKPGHQHEFEELAKKFVEAAKDIPQYHWTAYQMAYGHAEGPTYLVLTALKSGADADAEFGAGKAFDDAIGKDGMKKMAELEGASVASEMTNLFVVSPKMSLPTDAMVKSDPDFWKPKTAATTAKKAAAKPAATSGQ
jgi:quinol monooxygenase YgiN